MLDRSNNFSVCEFGPEKNFSVGGNWAEIYVPAWLQLVQKILKNFKPAQNYSK